MFNAILCYLKFAWKDKWSEMFCSIVSRAKTIQIVSSEVSGASGSLLLVSNQIVTYRRVIESICFLFSNSGIFFLFIQNRCMQSYKYYLH